MIYPSSTNGRKAFTAGSGEFDFSTLGTVYVWLDFSRVDTLFDATSGGNNVTDGGNILRAEDLSGNDYHYGSNNIATAPTWKESAINGIGAANCDGVDDHLNIGEPPNLAGDFTMLAVFQRATDGIYSSITGQASYVYAWPTDNNLYWGRWGGSPSTGPNLTGTTGDFIATITRDGSGDSNVYNNGALIDGPDNKAAGDLSLISLFRGPGYHSGYFAFMIVYDGILSAGDQDTAESELAAKFGITL